MLGQSVLIISLPVFSYLFVLRAFFLSSFVSVFLFCCFHFFLKLLNWCLLSLFFSVSLVLFRLFSFFLSGLPFVAGVAVVAAASVWALRMVNLFRKWGGLFWLYCYTV